MDFLSCNRIDSTKKMVNQQMYIPQHLRMDNHEFDEYYRTFGEDPQHIYNLVLAAHYVYRGGDGLALLDEINHKVPHRYSVNTIETAKNMIRNQEITLFQCIYQLWTQADMEYYGV